MEAVVDHAATDIGVHRLYVTCFSIEKKTQKINDLMWFFSIGLGGKDGTLKDWQVKTLESMLKDNNHTEARLL